MADTVTGPTEIETQRSGPGGPGFGSPPEGGAL